ncbi:hypothetical protein Golob_019075, partial [Gossypium lobatum]|nr:hypothetical protein [Gossypium lobatum]
MEATVIVVFVVAVKAAVLTTIMGLYLLLVGFPREESNPGIHYYSALPARPFYSSMSMVTKENRAAGVLDNFAEGEKYSEHFLRKYVRNKTPEIMPSINSFFTDP